MRSITVYLSFCLLTCYACSCTKLASLVKPEQMSSVNIINAVPNSTPLLASIGDSVDISVYFSTATQIPYGSYGEYSFKSGNEWSVIHQISDTVGSFFQGDINFSADGVYSFFISGSATQQSKPDTLLVRDSIPYHNLLDSTVEIRFVNLSQGSKSISIDLLGSSPGSVVSAINYRDITQFKAFPATSVISQYTFEFRDSYSDSILMTYNCSVSPFQNLTIAIIGTEGSASSNPLSVVLVNDF
jgi:hypothetical protein